MVTWTAGVSWPAGCSDVFQPPLEGYCEPVERAGERMTTRHTVRATEGILTCLDCWTELLVPDGGWGGWGWSEAAVGVAMTCCPVRWSEALSLRRLMGAGGLVYTMFNVACGIHNTLQGVSIIVAHSLSPPSLPSLALGQR